MATRAVLAELTAVFEQRSGCTVAVESVGGVDAFLRVQGGEAFDFVVLASDAIDRLVAARAVAGDSKVDLACSGVAVAVRVGALRPQIGTEDALKHAVLAARSIGYSTGPSGVALARLFERWGIAGQVAGRVVEAKPGVPVGSLVARGEVELGFQQLSELIHLEGIVVLGPMPDAIPIITTFSGGVCVGSTNSPAARGLLDFVARAEFNAVKRRHGMAPARANEEHGT